MASAVITAMAVMTMWMVASCTSEDSGRTERQNATLEMIEDSMNTNLTAAMAICDSMMGACADSMDYYDYEILKGKIYLLTDSPDNALPLVKRVYKFTDNNAKSPRMLGLKALALSVEASAYHIVRQNNEKAIELNTKALQLMMMSDIKEKCPELAANLADTYIYVDDIPQAAKWYRRALFLVDSLALPKERNLSLYMGLAQIYANIEDYKTAKYYYELTDKQFDNLKNNLQLYFLNNYGNLYYYQADYKNALKTFKRMEREIDSQNTASIFDRALCHINMADVYLNLENVDSAQIYLDKAEPTFKKNGMDLGCYYANTIRMGIAIKQNKYAVIDSVLKNEPNLDIDQAAIKNIRYRYLTQYYKHKGDYKKAYEVSTMAAKEKSSLEHKLSKMRTSEVMTRFVEDTIRLHHQIAISKKDASLAKANFAGIVLVALVLLMGLALLAIFINTRRKKTKARMDMILLRLENVRQRISPHFIFNLINSRISKESKEETDTLLKVSKLIRTNLDMSCKTCVTMNEELDFVEKYVDIEKHLMNEDIRLEIRHDDNVDLDTLTIPSMFVQIIVENAILHGLKGKDGDKTIKIAISQDHTNSYIHIIDNGRGFDIRRNEGSGTKNGLNIIRHTIAIINSGKPSSPQMDFDIKNIETPDGRICGCDALYTIPNNLNLQNILY